LNCGQNCGQNQKVTEQREIYNEQTDIDGRIINQNSRFSQSLSDFGTIFWEIKRLEHEYLNIEPLPPEKNSIVAFIVFLNAKKGFIKQKTNKKRPRKMI